MAASSENNIARVLRLFTILFRVASRRDGQRLGRAELAEVCECGIKTISRDLKLLQSAYIPIDYDPDQRAYVLPDKGWALTTATLSPSDTLSLGMALALLAGSAASLPLFGRIETALDKVTAGLPSGTRRQIQQLSAVLHASGGAARDYSHAPVELLVQAAQRQETVEMLYNSRKSGKCERRMVDPYRIDSREGRYWDMQARCHRDGRVKTFALDRVQEARLTGDTFVPEPWDDSDKGVVGGLRDGAWIELVVRFDSVVAPWARDRNWPFDATLTEEADGGVILRGQVRGMEGIVRELLSWRRHATVIGGPELRERMAEEVRAMFLLYDRVELREEITKKS